MYLARLLLLGIEKEIPRQQTPSNGESQPTYDFSLSKLFSNIFYAFLAKDHSGHNVLPLSVCLKLTWNFTFPYIFYTLQGTSLLFGM